MQDFKTALVWGEIGTNEEIENKELDKTKVYECVWVIKSQDSFHLLYSEPLYYYKSTINDMSHAFCKPAEYSTVEVILFVIMIPIFAITNVLGAYCHF